MTSSTDTSITKTAVIFAAVGFATGLLFAPKSGKESRKDIANKTAELKHRAVAAREQVKDKTTDATAAIKTAANDVAHRAKTVVSQTADDTTEIGAKMKSDSKHIKNTIRG